MTPSATELLQRRLLIEVAKDYDSHEWLDTTDVAGYLGTCPVTQRGFGWNVILLAEGIPLLIFFWATIENADGTQRSSPSQMLTLYQ